MGRPPMPGPLQIDSPVLKVAAVHKHSTAVHQQGMRRLPMSRHSLGIIRRQGRDALLYLKIPSSRSAQRHHSMRLNHHHQCQFAADSRMTCSMACKFSKRLNLHLAWG